MNPWGLWPAAVLLAATGGIGVISGCVVHWWCELRALRPAYLAARKPPVPRVTPGHPRR